MKETCICAIDPGLTGAIAFYFPSHPDRCGVEDMPVVSKETDAITLLRRLEQFKPDVIVIEIQHPMAKQGLGSTFRTGDNFGTVRGVAAGLKVPTYFVSAKDWKKHFRLDADKENARARALLLFPHSADMFRRKLDHGRAEACLIARWFSDTQLVKAAA